MRHPDPKQVPNPDAPDETEPMYDDDAPPCNCSNGTDYSMGYPRTCEACDGYGVRRSSNTPQDANGEPCGPVDREVHNETLDMLRAAVNERDALRDSQAFWKTLAEHLMLAKDTSETLADIRRRFGLDETPEGTK